MNKALSEYKATHGLSYDKIARIVGFKAGVIVQYHCKGQRGISAESALKYEKALGIHRSLLRPDLWEPPDMA